MENLNWVRYKTYQKLASGPALQTNAEALWDSTDVIYDYFHRSSFRWHIMTKNTSAFCFSVWNLCEICGIGKFSRPPSWKCQFPPGVTCAYVISHEPCCALFCSRQDGGKDIDSRGRRKTYFCPFSLRFPPIFSLFLLSLHLSRNEYNFYNKTGAIIAWSGAKSMIVAVVNFLTAQPVFLIHGLILVTF